MGHHREYQIMEKQVIELYDLGVLNKEILNAIMQPFCYSTIVCSVGNDLTSKNGKSSDEIICFIMEPEKYREATKFVYAQEEPEKNQKVSDLWLEIMCGEWHCQY